MTTDARTPTRSHPGAYRHRPAFWVDLFCGFIAIGVVLPLAAFVTFESARMPGTRRGEQLLFVAVGLAGFAFAGWLLRGAARAWCVRNEVVDPPAPRVPWQHWWWFEPAAWTVLSASIFFTDSGSLAMRLLWGAATLLFAVAFARELRQHLRARRAERRAAVSPAAQ